MMNGDGYGTENGMFFGVSGLLLLLFIWHREYHIYIYINECIHVGIHPVDPANLLGRMGVPCY